MVGGAVESVATSFADLCAAGAILGVLYNLTVAMLVARFPARHKRRPSGPFPAVTILKPLQRNEPGLFARLVSFCRQDYPAEVQIVCGLKSENHPAADVIGLLASTHPAARIDLKVEGRTHGTNDKVSNLINMQSLARHEVLVVSDSDIAVEPCFLRDVVSELQAPGVGAVSCAYFGIAAGGIWSRLSALHINTQFLPNVVSALSFDAVRPCFGAAIALDRNLLERIGGLRAVADELAEDFALGKAIRAAGYQVVIPRFLVAQVCHERAFQPAWARQMRLAETIRSIDPVGYLGTIFMHPVPLALIAAVLGVPHAGVLLATSVACRLVLCATVERTFCLPRQHYWLVPLHDLVSFAVFATSTFFSLAARRGRGYRVLPVKQNRSS
jgi:ceramide glucosyltransferase